MSSALCMTARMPASEQPRSKTMSLAQQSSLCQVFGFKGNILHLLVQAPGTAAVSMHIAQDSEAYVLCFLGLII